MLYIHIPFCDSKCFYCAFNSYTTKNYLKKDYFKALKTQFETESKPNKFKSVFIGGGTPSVMSLNFYEKLFNLISPYIDKYTEITIEANPNSTKIEWLKGLKEFGVNRISFGVQSFNDEKVKFLGRNHSLKSALLSIENSLKVFDNVNLDLIYATILDNKELLQNDLDIAVNLGISHISAYSLTIEKNTEFYKTPNKRKEDEALEIWFINEIKKHFKQYEISNFGEICRHNLGYWKLNPYIGLGAGAVGYDKINRYYTHKLPEDYIKNPTFKEIEYLKKYDKKEEQVLLGLRSIVGFDINLLNEEEKTKCFNLIEEKKLYLEKNRIFSKDFLLADALTSYILF